MGTSLAYHWPNTNIQSFITQPVFTKDCLKTKDTCQPTSFRESHQPLTSAMGKTKKKVADSICGTSGPDVISAKTFSSTSQNPVPRVRNPMPTKPKGQFGKQRKREDSKRQHCLHGFANPHSYGTSRSKTFKN